MWCMVGAKCDVTEEPQRVQNAFFLPALQPAPSIGGWKYELESRPEIWILDPF